MASKPRAARRVFHHRKKFIFALKAALAIVAHIFRTVEFRSGDHFQRNALFVGEGDGVGQMGAGQAGRIGDDRQHVGSESAVSDPGEIRGIDAAGIGDQHAAEVAQLRLQLRSLRGEGGFGGLHSHYGTSPGVGMSSQHDQLVGSASTAVPASARLPNEPILARREGEAEQIFIAHVGDGIAAVFESHAAAIPVVGGLRGCELQLVGLGVEAKTAGGAESAAGQRAITQRYAELLKLAGGLVGRGRAGAARPFRRQ